MRQILLIFFVFLCGFSSAQDPVTTAELHEHLAYLASDDLKGRFPGTEESKQAAQYILEQFKSFGLEPLGDDGYQYFNVVTAVKLSEGNSLSFAGTSYNVQRDFIPIGFSENKNISVPMVFAGYGFTIENDSVKWNDYENVDVQGKWVLVLRGDPENNPHSMKYADHSSLRKKALIAKDHGAEGIIFVSGPKYDEPDSLMRLGFDKSRSRAGIAVLQVKRYLADRFLKDTGKRISELEKTINTTLKPMSFKINKKISANIAVEHVEVATQNIVAVKWGNDPELKKEFIVIGAHYDHLGYGGWGSGSRTPDTLAIHNGADDNGSGVSSVLEIAEYFASVETARSILFISFGAEEMGLLGSKFFTAHPLIKLENIRLMLNLDMVGRLNNEDKLTMGGTGTAEGLDDLVREKGNGFNLKISTSFGGYGPSDHASFYSKNIPVLFFFTGTHDDYHKPSDDVEKINFKGMKEVCDYAISIAFAQASSKEKLTFTEAGSKEEPRRMRFRVTLGIIPDYGTDVKGLRIDGVKEDGPAFKGGLLKGDIIISMDDKPVNNIYDYMGRLGEFKPGQAIVVEAMRGKEKVKLNVTF